VVVVHYDLIAIAHSSPEDLINGGGMPELTISDLFLLAAFVAPAAVSLQV
jgi:hypothetical protein